MEREEFLKLDISEQVNFFNSKIQEGQSITQIAKELGISKSISNKFKKHGYSLGASRKEKQIESSRVGRPLSNKETSKHTVIFDTKLWKNLKIKSIQEDRTASEILEKLAMTYLNK